MANEKKIYGHIDCPLCGYAQGMRVTADKNGKPFGFCEANCDGQLRIGGKPRREAAFFKKYPHIAEAFGVADTAPKTEEKPVTVTEPEPAPAPVKKSSFSLDNL